jgi:hypothetical protein
MTFEIEKNIAIPEIDKTRVGRKTKYPFREMEIGDSFVARKNAISAAQTHSARHKEKFSIRRIDDDNIRIWRIA